MLYCCFIIHRERKLEVQYVKKKWIGVVYHGRGKERREKGRKKGRKKGKRSVTRRIWGRDTVIQERESERKKEQKKLFEVEEGF
jgi:hypothetical protein